MDVDDKSPQLGLFNFRAFLNLGMLLTESEKAKSLRSIILDIALDTINKRTGGSTKYITNVSIHEGFSGFVPHQLWLQPHSKLRRLLSNKFIDERYST